MNLCLVEYVYECRSVKLYGCTFENIKRTNTTLQCTINVFQPSTLESFNYIQPRSHGCIEIKVNITNINNNCVLVAWGEDIIVYEKWCINVTPIYTSAPTLNYE